MRLSGSILVNCSPLNSGIQLWESVTLGRPVLKDQAQQQVEQEISWKTWEVMCLQVKGELEKKELQDRLKDLAALEGKRSLLQSELVVARETLEESHLQRDLLKQEKHELTRALEKAEQSVAELAGAPNKRSAEVADLHVATVKMSSINEALVLDKVQLKKLVLQLEQENDVLSAKVDKMERAKISDQEKLNLCERTNEELCTEKGHLEQLLKKAEEQQEGLQVELRILVEEKAETQEKLDESPTCAREEAPNSIQPTLLRATLAEDEELKEMAETVVQEVLERVKALDPSVRVLRRAPREVSGRLFASARGAEPLDPSPANRRDKIRLVAREIVATVLESFGEHLVSGTSDAAEPGLAARQKLSELVAGRATRAGKSGEERWREAELATSDRASSQSSIDKTTKEAVESVCSTLSSFVASQFEQDFCCQFSEILKLQGVTEGQGPPRALEWQIPEASRRAKLPVLQPLQNAAYVSRVSRQIAKESIQEAVSRIQQLEAELIGYAKTIVLEVLETVRKKLEEDRKSKQKSEKLQPPLSLPAIVTPSEEAGEFKEERSRTLLPSVLRGAEQHARRPTEGLQKSRDDTSGGTARSSVPAWETLRILRPGSTAGTLPSTGPRFPRQPMPPVGPKPPSQAGARHRPERLKLFLEEPVQPE
ncbi:uncharacterized protein LOC142089546 [Calonectris borealis]|uniref:uncharacterized protein LOC142089546 n=1 Tax=Calonectris borealis TaxID=1323832 RepID=UPI003F4C80E6